MHPRTLTKNVYLLTGLLDVPRLSFLSAATVGFGVVKVLLSTVKLDLY